MLNDSKPCWRPRDRGVREEHVGKILSVKLGTICSKPERKLAIISVICSKPVLGLQWGTIVGAVAFAEKKKKKEDNETSYYLSAVNLCSALSYFTAMTTSQTSPVQQSFSKLASDTDAPSSSVAAAAAAAAAVAAAAAAAAASASPDNRDQHTYSSAQSARSAAHPRTNPKTGSHTEPQAQSPGKSPAQSLGQSPGQSQAPYQAQSQTQPQAQAHEHNQAQPQTQIQTQGQGQAQPQQQGQKQVTSHDELREIQPQEHLGLSPENENVYRGTLRASVPAFPPSTANAASGSSTPVTTSVPTGTHNMMTVSPPASSAVNTYPMVSVPHAVGSPPVVSMSPSINAVRNMNATSVLRSPRVTNALPAGNISAAVNTSAALNTTPSVNETVAGTPEGVMTTTPMGPNEATVVDASHTSQPLSVVSPPSTGAFSTNVPPSSGGMVSVAPSLPTMDNSKAKGTVSSLQQPSPIGSKLQSSPQLQSTSTQSPAHGLQQPQSQPHPQLKLEAEIKSQAQLQTLSQELSQTQAQIHSQLQAHSHSQSQSHSQTPSQSQSQPSLPGVGSPIQKKNAPQAPFICDVAGCGKAFGKKFNLKAHKRVHTGDEPFACSYPMCGKRFKWKSSLTFHEGLHLNVPDDPQPAVSSGPATSSAADLTTAASVSKTPGKV